VPDKNEEPREGFQVLAELTNRYWRQLQMHAGTAANVGPGALLPAVTLPQAQLDVQRAIREAFHAGAAFQASLPPSHWKFTIDEGDLFAAGDGARTVTMVSAPHAAIDLNTVELPQRVPNEYVKLFTDEALQLLCPTCHQSMPHPRRVAVAVPTAVAP
jgi:hypothetical protein